jgi:hypothetical protein
MNETNIHMFLIYPGMSDFEEVEIIEPATEAGFCYVRPMGADEHMKVHTSRLVDRETAMTRSQTRTFTRTDEYGSYTVTEHTVKAV